MHTLKEYKVYEYAIIGGGPAGVCAVPNILNFGVPGESILWVDPEFQVGAFGATLSKGSSVPGNTSVANYQKVNQEIYKIIPTCLPNKQQAFEIDNQDPTFVCSLKMAAEPLQHITNKLREIVNSIKGTVSDIFTVQHGLKINIKLSDGSIQSIFAKRVILATGAHAKSLELPSKHNEIRMIEPNTVFIRSSLAEYMQKNPSVTTVAVIGSSHSAALATMHLLQAGLNVKQFMNKEYKYAEPFITADGKKSTKWDNTGLKGDVAEFTRQLLNDVASGKGEYRNKLTRYIGGSRKEVTTLLNQHLSGCDRAVAVIGYQPSCTLRINNVPLAHYSHNNKTTQFKLEHVDGLFGIGVAFPEEVTAISGEVESAVGIGKFWATVSNQKVREIWEKHSFVKNSSQQTNYFFSQVCLDHKDASPAFISCPPIWSQL